MSNTITQTKTVLINIPLLIEEFYYALEAEDYDKCKELKDFFYGKYEEFSDQLQSDFKDFLIKFLEDSDIDNKKDLNGLFDQVLN